MKVDKHEIDAVEKIALETELKQSVELANLELAHAGGGFAEPIFA